MSTIAPAADFGVMVDPLAPRPRRAGFWIRLLAALIDGVVFLVLQVASNLALNSVWQRTLDADRAYAAAALVVSAGWSLYTLLEIFTAGTLGKLALGLRIRQQDGRPADRWRLFLRWESKQLPILAAAGFALTGFIAFQLLSAFMYTIVLAGCFFAANDDHLAWHDQWAGTCVRWK